MYSKKMKIIKKKIEKNKEKQERRKEQQTKIWMKIKMERKQIETKENNK